jgi:hypothetical protein
MSEETLCVVRLRRTAWYDRRGVYYKTSLTYLQRKSKGFNFLEEELDVVGAHNVLITNIDEVNEGVYSVEICNISRDYESGYIDGYDLKLVPYTEAA